METIPPLCLDLILNNHIISPNGYAEKDYKICIYAANYALVGNQFFTDFARLLWNVVDPKCSDIHHKNYEKELKDWEELNAKYEIYLDNIPKPKQSNLLANSKIKEFQEELLKFNIRRKSGNKSDYWKLLQDAIQQDQLRYTKAIEDLEDKRDTRPTLPKCFIRPEIIKKIKNVKEQRITITKAKKEYLLTDKDLESLKYESVQNPHYRSAAPMKLYLLSEIEELHDKKFKNKKELNKAIEKREIKALKAKETHQRNRITRQQELNSLFTESELTRLIEYSDVCFKYYDKYLDCGNQNMKNNLQQCLNRMIQLRESLEEHGCELRQDSRLCLNYINYDDEYLGDIVETMVEMKFLFTHTNYQNHRDEIFTRLIEEEREFGHYYDFEEMSLEATEKAKKKAIKNLPNALSHPDLPPRFRQWCIS